MLSHVHELMKRGLCIMGDNCPYKKNLTNFRCVTGTGLTCLTFVLFWSGLRGGQFVFTVIQHTLRLHSNVKHKAILGEQGIDPTPPPLPVVVKENVKQTNEESISGPAVGIKPTTPLSSVNLVYI